MSDLFVVALFGISILIAIAIVPAVIGLFFMIGTKSTQRHYQRLHSLAHQKGWQVNATGIGAALGSPFPIYGKLPNSQNWRLRYFSGNKYNYVWETSIQQWQGEASIFGKMSMPLYTTGLTSHKRYRKGSKHLQNEFFLSATNEQILETLLTPKVESLLLGWPKLSVQRIRRLDITIKKGKLILMTRRLDASIEDRVTDIVALGTEIAMTLS